MRDARQQAVEEVLAAFKDMGGTDEQLAEERARLEQDDMYLSGWQSTIRRAKK